ncbi:TPA: ComC/BlpC family peptide pheromone/bacteriocin [Streptococcus suis]
MSELQLDKNNTMEVFNMNTKIMERFEEIRGDRLLDIKGGFPWGTLFSGAIDAMDGGGPTLDQLNGKWPKRNPPRPCTPFGTGGTPNACNGL